MSNVQNDKAARAKSAEKIERAFFELIRERRYSDVSVIDICEAAGVARKTFYRNYESKAQVIERKADREFAKFLEQFNPETVDTRVMYLYVYERILSDKPFAAAMRDDNVIAILTEKIVEYFENIFETVYLNAPLFEPRLGGYYIRFFAVGLESLLKSWIDDDCKIPPMTMASLTEKLLYGVTRQTR